MSSNVIKSERLAKHSLNGVDYRLPRTKSQHQQELIESPLMATDMNSKHQGKVVWITGGGSGLGRSLAQTYAERGATVVVSGRRADKLEETLDLMREVSPDASHSALQCDVTDTDAVVTTVDTIVERYGRLDVCVANAGFSLQGPVEMLSVADYRRQFEVNVFGVINTVQAALPHIRKTKGRVAIIGSVLSFIALPGGSPYAASKYAIRGFGQALALELAPTGASCTMIYPGFVDTEIGKVDNQGRFDANRKSAIPSQFAWDAERAGKVMWRAIEKRKREYVFTFHGKATVALSRLFPSAIHVALTKVGQSKKFKKMRGNRG